MIIGGDDLLKDYSWIPTVFLACIIIVMVILLIVRLRKGGKQQKKFRDLQKYTPYDKELIWDNLPRSPTYNEYTINMSFKISDWEYNYDKPKLIFYRGSKLDDGSLIVNPGVWIYPKTANLMVRISNLNNKCQELGCNFKNIKQRTTGNLLAQTVQNSVYDCEQQCINYTDSVNPKVRCEGIDFDQFNKMPNCSLYTNSDIPGAQNNGRYFGRTFDSDPNNLLSYSANTVKQCDIKGIPLQSWVNLTLVYYNNQLDIYINGILKRSCNNIVSIPFELESNKGGTTNQKKPYDIVVNPEFKGEIKDMKYFDYSLNSTQISSMSGLSNAKLRENIPKFI
tara:strand:+ start:1573 stop:2583 length:1011 start_codon:yes stop_codon:yes gene_type:complete